MASATLTQCTRSACELFVSTKAFPFPPAYEPQLLNFCSKSDKAQSFKIKVKWN